MNKAETEESETDENVNVKAKTEESETDENVNVSNERNLVEEKETQDEEKAKAYQITQDEEIAKALYEQSNLGRGMRNLTKIAVSRDANELMFTLMKQNMIIGQSFNVSIIPYYETQITRIMHYKHTSIDNEKKLYFKIDNIISSHAAITLSQKTISFFCKNLK
jgi:hypothetical protein